jgi:ADP-ribose pyrophosphatase YjhB (NUDIX family)
MICIRCGEEYHTCKNCTNAITSFGLVVFAKRKNLHQVGKLYESTDTYKCNNKKAHALTPTDSKYCIYNRFVQNLDDQDYYFLLVERKDTIAYISLVQGIRNSNEKLIKDYISELTCYERYKLCNYTWEQLFETTGSYKRNNQEESRQQFDSFDKSFLDDIYCKHSTADYVIPKGKLKIKESTLECAIREFAEESGYSENDIIIRPDLGIWTEEFTANENLYKNVYYVAELLSNATIKVPLNMNKEQCREVGNVGWFNIKEAVDIIRETHFQKKGILYSIWNKLMGKDT